MGFFLRTAMVLFIIVAGASSGNGQTAISMTGVAGLTFGTFSRSSELVVAYSSSQAARFTITGDTASNVRITIAITNLAALSGASINSSDRDIGITISNSDCAYSLDGGTTWTTFSTGTLYQDTQFPASLSGRSSIDVRVGGSIASGTRQQRGSYSGSVTIMAEYR
ncbi:MAG: hypothetical protein JWQ98_1982 [Chlorobi bacterium]|nr:hypothetical protein [Chlorobiota bacterium]